MRLGEMGQLVLERTGWQIDVCGKAVVGYQSKM